VTKVGRRPDSSPFSRTHDFQVENVCVEEPLSFRSLFTQEKTFNAKQVRYTSKVKEQVLVLKNRRVTWLEHDDPLLIGSLPIRMESCLKLSFDH
jgi:hypothetical protein